MNGSANRPRSAHGAPDGSASLRRVEWLSADEQAAWRGMLRMQAQLGAHLSRELSAHSDLSLQDYSVLVALSEQPDGRLRGFALARDLGWEKSRVSHHLARMERRGLLRRQPCPGDQRGQYWVIARRGLVALESAAPTHVADVRRAFVDRLTPGQLRALAAIADAVLGGLDTSGETGEPR